MNDEMGRELFWPLFIVMLLGLSAFGIYAFARNYSECRAVPHTAFYCLTSGQ